MEQNSTETPAPAQGDSEAAAPKRRRASRRVTAAAGEAVVVTSEQAAPEKAAPEKTVTGRAATGRAAADKAAALKTADASVAKAEKPARTTAPRRTSKAAAAAAAVAETSAATAAPVAAAAVDASEEAPKKRPTRSRKKPEAVVENAAAGNATAAGNSAAAGNTSASENTATVESAAPAADAHAAAAPVAAGEGEATAPKRRNTRSRGKKQSDDGSNNSNNSNNERSGESAQQQNQNRHQNNADTAAASSDNAETETEDRRGSGNGNQQSRNGENQQSRNGDTQQRSSRTRQRERKRRQSDDVEPEINEDDVLLPVAGILDVLDNYAFVRTSGYLPGTNDVYISLGQVKKYGLRKGDAIVGAIRQPNDADNGGRQKYNAIVKIDSINSRPVDENETRDEFAALTPLSPEERLTLAGAENGVAARMIDLFTPIGKGQRALISGPARSGKSTLVSEIAAAISAQHADAHLMVVLIDERPEEVTRLQRSLGGEVIASTFDRAAEDHVTIAELALERAKRLVELGHDVVVLIDSVSSLVRAYNLLTPAETRGPAGVIDAAAVVQVKQLLSAARNIENGGSLTVIATAQTGTPVDEIVLDELLGAVNLELRLSRDLAQRQLFPAIDVAASSTRHSEMLVGADEQRALSTLRRRLAEQGAETALAGVLEQLGATASNTEFLALAARARA